MRWAELTAAPLVILDCLLFRPIMLMGVLPRLCAWFFSCGWVVVYYYCWFVADEPRLLGPTTLWRRLFC